MSEDVPPPPPSIPPCGGTEGTEKGSVERLAGSPVPAKLARDGGGGGSNTSSGNLVAVGVDLADVGRVRKALARFPERFVERVLTESEAAYCLSKPDPAPHITARFAAKEAVIKCLGGGCDLKDIEVKRALSGAPSITLTGRAAEKAAGRKVLISLSHLPDIACAFATLVDTVEN